MKLILRASALAVLLYLPAPAMAWFPGGNVKVDAGVNIYCNVYTSEQQQLAPWYLYWPAEAANLPPSPLGMSFPNWPSTWPPPGGNGGLPHMPPANPLSAPVPGAGSPPSKGAPPGTVSAYQPQPFQPVSYYSQAPSYWYGK